MKLGDKVKCRVTGFIGTATHKWEQLYSTTQWYVIGFDQHHNIREQWLPEPQIQLVDEKPLASVSEIKGS